MALKAGTPAASETHLGPITRLSQIVEHESRRPRLLLCRGFGCSCHGRTALETGRGMCVGAKMAEQAHTHSMGGSGRGNLNPKGADFGYKGGGVQRLTPGRPILDPKFWLGKIKFE